MYYVMAILYENEINRNAFAKSAAVGQEAFVRAGMFFLKEYLQNSQVAPLLKILECERFHNADADREWCELLILAPLEHEANVFRMLKERGEIVDEVAEELAAEYQSAIMFAYFTGDVKLLEIQLQRFYQRVFIN